ncbi:MAG TPA: OmpW family outer membrane protein [Parvibaculum sp.]|jgi:opacity protein-like surface antigen
MKISKILLASTMLCALSAAPAMAGEMSNGNAYAKLSGGAIIPEDIDADLGGGFNGKLTFDTGWTASATVGFWLNNNFALEGELGYLAADMDKFEISGVGSAKIDGDVSSILGFVNANYHLSGRNAGFDPYIGAGVGFARSKVSVDSVGGFPIGVSDDSTDAALQGTAGFDFNLGGGTKIGAQYRYIYTDTGGSGVDAFTAHAITAHAVFAF